MEDLLDLLNYVSTVERHTTSCNDWVSTKFFKGILLAAVTMTGCGASKGNNSQSQYVPVPAITGEWNAAATVASSTSTLQVNLVSVPCSVIDSLNPSPEVGPAQVSSWASSCSLADNLTGQGSVTALSFAFDYPPQILVVAAASSGSSTNPTTSMNLAMLECSGTSTECYANQPTVVFTGQGSTAASSGSLSGTWQGGGGTGTFTATQQ
jgi:hypothetical protein